MLTATLPIGVGIRYLVFEHSDDLPLPGVNWNPRVLSMQMTSQRMASMGAKANERRFETRPLTPTLMQSNSIN